MSLDHSAGRATSPSPSESRVSLRAVLLGLLFCFGIAAGEPFGVLVLQGSPMGADFSTGAALFLFFLLTFLLNPIARLLTGSGLRRGELATIYIMMIVATAIPSWGLTMNLIPLISGIYYYATPGNSWSSLIHPHLPAWLVAGDREANWKLFEGAAPGESVPWETWLTPFLAWSLFMVTIYFVTLCLLVILRKQWVEREKLLFPLAVLPLEMSAVEERRLLPPIFRNPVMWLGFLVPAVINSLKGLHSYYNWVPAIDLTNSIPILQGPFAIQATPRFEVIGLSYLLSLDVSFGVWFFSLMALLATSVQNRLGWSIGAVQPASDPAGPAVAHLALGALFVLVAFSFWNGRRHVADVVRKALGRAPDVDDSNELMSYRTAVFGTLVGVVIAAYWLMAIGMNLLTIFVFLVSALVIFIGLARIVSQTGLAYCRATVAAPMFTVNVLGTSVLGAAGITALSLSFPWSLDVRTFVMASAATGLKLASELRLETRRLFVAIMATIAVALIGSFWAIIQLGYSYGAINLTSWQFSGLPLMTGNWITRNIGSLESTRIWHLAFTGVGAVVMTVLMSIKARFTGFPIHPIGMTLGLTHPVYYVWFSVFIAWIFKAAALKYGGPRTYLFTRPFFLGMALGGFASAGIWLFVDYLTGMSGNNFTVG